MPNPHPRAIAIPEAKSNGGVSETHDAYPDIVAVLDRGKTRVRALAQLRDFLPRCFSKTELAKSLNQNQSDLRVFADQCHMASCEMVSAAASDRSDTLPVGGNRVRQVAARDPDQCCRRSPAVNDGACHSTQDGLSRSKLSGSPPSFLAWLFSPSSYFPFGERSGLLDKRRPDPKRRAAVIPIFRRYQPIVRLDDGARDGQPHAHAFRLAGKKRFEDRF